MKILSPLLIALSLSIALTSSRVAWADGPADAVQARPSYTLAVDGGGVLTFDALAPRLREELGADVTSESETLPTRAAIIVRYDAAAQQLEVRTIRTNGRVVERTVHASGDAKSVETTAVLLVGNLARDEWNELIEQLAQPAPGDAIEAPIASEPESKPAGPRAHDEHVPVNLGFFYPLSTNMHQPHVGTHADISASFTHIGMLDGVQLAGVGSYVSRSAKGLQMAGAFHFVNGSFRGTQLAGAANVVVGSGRGVQMSGATNVATEAFSGLQMTGGTNYTPQLVGTQMSPINVAQNVHGLQFGVVNVGGRVRGLQFGVFNIAVDMEMEGEQLGVISISRNSIHPIAWTSNLAYANVGLRFQSRHLYSIVAFTAGTPEAKKVDYGTTGAFGVRLPIWNKLDTDIEGAFSNTFAVNENNSGHNNAARTRVMLGWTFADHLRVFAGGGARFATKFDEGRNAPKAEFLAGLMF